jgi:hypothetical protein
MTNVDRESWDWKNVRDFDWLTKFYHDNVLPKFEEGSDQLCPRTGMKWNYNVLQKESNRLGYEIRSKLDLEIADLGKEGSRFFKEVYINPSRLGAQVKEENVEDTLE